MLISVRQIWFMLISDKCKPQNLISKHICRPGELVRIAKENNVFAKGYRPNWTSEIFKIKTVKSTKEPSYTLTDLHGEDILGSFLEPELQAVSEEETQTYKVRKVLRHRGRGRNKESLVLWEGFPDKYKRWIPH